MKTTLCLTLTLLIFAIFAFVPNTFAQDYTQWHLPDDAIARFGKGKVNELKYSPDDTKLAVVSQIGVWIYNAKTYQELSLLTIHSGSINSVVFSPDGTLLQGEVQTTLSICGTQTMARI